MTTRLASRVAVFGMVAGLAVVGSAGAAHAHAQLVVASPAPGTGVPQPPEAVVVRFTEPLDLRLSRLEVHGTDGRSVTVGPTVRVPGDQRAMRRAITNVPPGVYVVEWTTVSTIDGHHLAGSYRFAVGTATVAAAHADEGAVASQGVLGVVGRVLAATGLALWLGGAVLESRARAAGLPQRRATLLRRLPPATVAIGTALAALGIARVATGSPADAVAVLTGSRSGWLHLGTVVAATAGAITAMAGPAAAYSVLAVGATVAEVAAGHAAVGPWPLVVTALFTLHVAAVGIWLFAITAAVLTRPARPLLTAPPTPLSSSRRRPSSSPPNTATWCSSRSPSSA